jgi:hypothetical protein|tara:strand:+ start:22 stop:507 length:486 start_codon:yes stop_codon:yes gene_type:complete
MKKKYFTISLFILIIFINGCAGYKTIFNSTSLMLEIKNYEIEGDKKLGKRMYMKLSNSLKTQSEGNKKKIDLLIDMTKKTEDTIKSQSGKILEQKITLNTILNVKNYETGNLILNKTYTNSLSYKIQDQYSETISAKNKAIDNLINQTYQEFLITLIQNIN